MGTAPLAGPQLAQPCVNRAERTDLPTESPAAFPYRPFLSAIGLTSCGYNNLQSNDEQIKASGSEVVSQYQRRADLVPNLVNTVKGFAAREQTVLLGVTEARARVGTVQAAPELVNDQTAFKKFQAAQGDLSQALARLLVVTENYPQLKSDANFRDLQVQLEGAENRVAVARNRYIAAIQGYNVTVSSFPSNHHRDRIRL